MESGVCAICRRSTQDIVDHLKELIENDKKEKIKEILNRTDVINFSKEIKEYNKLINTVKNLKKEYLELKISTVLDGEHIFTDIFESINTIFNRINTKYSKITEESTLEQLFEEFKNKEPVDKSKELINNIEKQYDIKLDKIRNADRTRILQKTQVGDSLHKSLFCQIFDSLTITDYICITCREIISKFGPIN